MRVPRRRLALALAAPLALVAAWLSLQGGELRLPRAAEAGIPFPDARRLHARPPAPQAPPVVDTPVVDTPDGGGPEGGSTEAAPPPAAAPAAQQPGAAPPAEPSSVPPQAAAIEPSSAPLQPVPPRELVRVPVYFFVPVFVPFPTDGMGPPPATSAASTSP